MFKGEWRVPTLFVLATVPPLLALCKIFDWHGQGPTAAAMVIVGITAWIHAGKAIEADRERRRSGPSAAGS